MMFDLNEVPACEEEVPACEETVEITRERPNAQGGTEGSRTSADNAPLIGPWWTLSPSELASLHIMSQVPANCPRVHHVITHRVDGISEHGWISWMPAHHATKGGTVVHSSEWRTMPSIFAPPPLPVVPIASRPLRQAAPDVPSAFFDPRRLWSHGGPQQAAPQAITNDAEMERCDQRGSDDSDGIEPALTGHRNNRPTKNSMMERRSAVRLVELGPDSEGGRGVLTPVGAPSPPPSAQNQQDIGSSSQRGAENNDEAEIDWGSTNLGAELLAHLAREERGKSREAAFLAEFNFTTQRCRATAPCSSCLEFCKVPVPVDLAESCLEVSDRPPVLKNTAAQRTGARHGPRSKSSEYRGVTFYKRTGRWESHIWHNGGQLYLGASATKELAAKAYDKAALMLGGPQAGINFGPESYEDEMKYLCKLSKEQLVIYLRRDSRGFGAQAAYPGVKRVRDQYHAFSEETLIGTSSTEEEAARLVFKDALNQSFGALASWIIDTHHVRSMPSYAAQLHAAVYPESVEAMMLNTPTKASKRRCNSYSRVLKKSTSDPLSRQKPSSESAPVARSATVSDNPIKQLPATQIDDIALPPAKRSRSTWRQACKRGYNPTDLTAAHDPPTTSVVPPASSARPACNTTSPGVRVSRISPSSAAAILLAFNGTGQTPAP